jgi:uncharacterized protein (TIGR02271 family)
MNRNEPTTARSDLARLSNLTDLEVASDSTDVRGWDVTSDDEQTIGRVDDLIIDVGAMKARYLLVDLVHSLRRGSAEAGRDGNQHVLLPAERAHIDRSGHRVEVDVPAAGFATLPRFTGPIATDADDTYRRSMPSAKPRPDGGAGERVLTRSDEELRIGKRRVPAGEVKIAKHVETEHVTQPATKKREDVRVERRPATTVSASGRTPEMKDDEIRIPITEEELVVDKRPVVKEELVVAKETKDENVDVEADLRKERVVVDRPDRPSRHDRTR